jgi:hypothetical protein
MGWNDHLPEDEPGFRSYMAALVESRRLDARSAAGQLASRAAREGTSGFTAEELERIGREVLLPFGRRKCSLCGVLVPWAEMLDALDGAPRCGWCRRSEEERA